MHQQAASLSDQDMQDIAAYFGSDSLKPTATAVGEAPAKVALCGSCHGKNGVGITGDYPDLAGQHADYLRREIAQYKDGGRRNQIMAGMAVPLTDHDVEEITQYYSSLTPSLKTEERPYTRLTAEP